MSLYHHWFRAALSMLGISWGIVSVVVLLAYGDGFRMALDAGFRGAFSDGTVVTQIGPDEPAGRRRARRQTRAADAGRRHERWRASAREAIQSRIHVGVPDRVRQQAVEPDRPGGGGELRRNAKRTPQPGGRFLDDEDVRLRRRVAFIGTEVQRKLFGAVPPVGETIRIGGQPFDIVGVMEEKVQLSNYNRPDKYCVFIPWTTMSGLIDTQQVGTFVWQSVSPMLEPKAERQVREYPRQSVSVRSGRRARGQHVRVCASAEDHRRHRQRTAHRPDLHRRADAGDRRRRHHEHHVRERSGTDARDRRAESARLDQPARSCCSSCSRGW